MTKGLVKKIGVIGAVVGGLMLGSCIKEYNTPQHKFKQNTFTKSITEYKEGGHEIEYISTFTENGLRKVIVDGNNYTNKHNPVYIEGVVIYNQMLNEIDSIRREESLKIRDKNAEKMNRDLEVLRK